MQPNKNKRIYSDKTDKLTKKYWDKYFLIVKLTSDIGEALQRSDVDFSEEDIETIIRHTDDIVHTIFPHDIAIPLNLKPVRAEHKHPVSDWITKTNEKMKSPDQSSDLVCGGISDYLKHVEQWVHDKAENWGENTELPKDLDLNEVYPRFSLNFPLICSDNKVDEPPKNLVFPKEQVTNQSWPWSYIDETPKSNSYELEKQ